MNILMERYAHWYTYRLYFDRDALGESADGRHPSAERFPDDAVPLQGALAAALQTPQTSTQGRQRGSRAEHGLHLHAEEDKESRRSSHGTEPHVEPHCDISVEYCQ